MEYVLFFFLMVFSAASIIEGFFTFSAMRRAYERSFRRQLIIVPITSNMQDIEMVLRNTDAMAKKSDYGCRIILCDMGADENVMNICRLFARDKEYIELCSRETVQNQLHFM